MREALAHRLLTVFWLRKVSSSSLRRATAMAVVHLLCVAGVVAPAMSLLAEAQAPSAPPPPPLRYDIVLLHALKPPFDRACDVPDGADRTTVCGSLRELVANAFRVCRLCVVGVPKWAQSPEYTFIGKVEDRDMPALGRLDWRDRGPLLVPVLAERFGLEVHRKTRMVPGYTLHVARGGVRMKPVAVTAPGEGQADARESLDIQEDTITGHAVGLRTLARVLAGTLGTPVMDETGDPGRYDFTVDAKMRDGAATGSAATSAAVSLAGEDQGAQHLFNAVQEQLGLVLRAQKVPVGYVVIESAHPPVLD